MGNTPKILVVDDEERIREALQDILLTQGYEILQAADGVEALEIIAKNGPDVVLLDLSMPRMDGLEVIRKIKSEERLKHIPLVIVSGLDEIDLRVQAFKLGADDFLTKPPHMAELCARVRSLVKVKAYHDHLMTYQHELKAEVDKRTRQLKKALKNLHQVHQRLRKSSLDTIYCLARASEYKDEDTAEHIQRVSRYVAVIGRRLGLDKDAVESIVYASPMHDIGKIGVPDRILLKPGKLTSEEWTIMKQHTTFGGQILSSATNGFLEVARIIALTHHERWDGSGYPRGLKGDEIPLCGRITAIVDVFDALTSNRPYKKAFPMEQSLQIVRESSGSHFDPQIAEVFLQVQHDIFRVKESSKDRAPSLLSQLAQVE